MKVYPGEPAYYEGRIKDLEARIQAYQDRDTLIPLKEAFIENLDAILSLTAYHNWPLVAKQALEATHQLTAIELYKSRLPIN